MSKKYITCLVIFLFAAVCTSRSYGAFRIHAKKNLTESVTVNSANLAADQRGAEDALASSGHHGGGHHGGGHHSHGGGHSHAHYSHHSYRSHGHPHHYAQHYQHYHNHYHVRHEARVGPTDYAGTSIVFDVLGVIPIGVFSLLGVVFGALGMHYGMRPRLAKTGLIIGIVELAILVLALAVLAVIYSL